MKINAIFTVLVCFFAAVDSLAQDADTVFRKNKVVYINSLHFGGLAGKNTETTSLSLAMHHGIRVSRLAITLGLGIDNYYNWTVTPLTVQAAYELVRIKNVSFFAAVNSGYSHVSARAPLKEYGSSFDTDPGIVLNPTLGVRLKAGNASIYFQAGYKWQRINYTYGPRFWYGAATAPLYFVEENLRRLHFSLGVGLH